MSITGKLGWDTISGYNAFNATYFSGDVDIDVVYDVSGNTLKTGDLILRHGNIYTGSTALFNTIPVSYFTGLTSNIQTQLSAVTTSATASYIGYIPTTSSTGNIPTNIATCVLWLDASDPLANTTLPTYGSTISTWYDKSGLGHNATAGGSTAILTSVAWNSTGSSSSGTQVAHPTLKFASGSYFTAPWLYTGSTMSVFIVVDMSAANSYSRVITFQSSGNYSYSSMLSCALIQQANTAYISATRNTYPSVTTLMTNTITSSTTYLYEMWFDGTTGYISVHTGGSVTTPIATWSSSGAFNFTKITLGIEGFFFTDSFNGYMSEIVVYNTALSLSDRQKMEGYLSWKWGIQGNLPTTHPYFSSAPSTPIATSYIGIVSQNYDWTGIQTFSSCPIYNSTILPTSDNGNSLVTSAWVKSLNYGSSGVSLSAANTWSSIQTFSSCPIYTGTALASTDNTTNLATTAWVKSLGYGSSGVSLSAANTWTNIQTFSSVPVYSGGILSTTDSSTNLATTAWVKSLGYGSSGVSLSAANTWTLSQTFSSVPKYTGTILLTSDSSTNLSTTAWVKSLGYGSSSISLSVRNTWTESQTFSRDSMFADIIVNGLAQCYKIVSILPALGGEEGTNISIGTDSLGSILSTSFQNVGVGTNTLRQCTSGYSNLAIGHGSQYSLGTGYSNVSVGCNALTSNISGNQNVGIGASSGSNGYTTGSSNTYIGYNAGSNNSSDYSYSTALGAYSANTANHQIQLGTTTEYVNIPSTTASSSVGTGALVVAGGIGCTGAGYFGGIGCTGAGYFGSLKTSGLNVPLMQHGISAPSVSGTCTVTFPTAFGGTPTVILTVAYTGTAYQSYSPVLTAVYNSSFSYNLWVTGTHFEQYASCHWIAMYN